MKTEEGNFKKDGFNGQRAIVLPKSILNKFCSQNLIINKAYITDVGFYPKAKFHYRERKNGAEQNVLIYCVEGRGQVKIEEKEFSILPGDFFVIPFGKPHSYGTDIQNPWTIYWCHFKGKQTDEIINQIQQKYKSFKSTVIFSDERIEIFNKLYKNLEAGYSFENISYVNLIFLQFLCSFLFSDRFYNNLETRTEVDQVEESIRFMQKNIEKVLTLPELAKYVNSSPSHFSATFKKSTGFPPIEYLNHLKIQKACQYLQFTELRIKEIAFKIGIDDQYYFSRLFTKTMGFSPSRYKKQRTLVK